MFQGIFHVYYCIPFVPVLYAKECKKASLETLEQRNTWEEQEAGQQIQE